MYDSADDSDRSMYLNCYKKEKKYKKSLKLTADGPFLSNEKCKQEAEDSTFESTADAPFLSDEEEVEDSQDILAPSIAIGNKDCRIPEATAGLSVEKISTFESTEDGAFLSDEECKQEEVSMDILAPSTAIGNKDCQIPEATAGMSVEKLSQPETLHTCGT